MPHVITCNFPLKYLWRNWPKIINNFLEGIKTILMATNSTTDWTRLGSMVMSPHFSICTGKCLKAHKKTSHGFHWRKVLQSDGTGRKKQHNCYSVDGGNWWAQIPRRGQGCQFHSEVIPQADSPTNIEELERASGKQDYHSIIHMTSSTPHCQTISK